MRLGHQGLSKTPAHPQPDPTTSPASSQLHGRPPWRAAGGGPLSPAPCPRKSSFKLARAATVPGLSGPALLTWRRGHCSGSKVRPATASWAGGPREGYKCPPPGWAPAQKGHGALLRPMGAQGPPHLPRLPGVAQPRATIPSKKPWGGGSEVELLYLGTGDELEAFLLLARSLRAAMCSLQGPQEPGWVHGSRSTVGSLGPWPRWVLQQGPHHSVLPGTLATSPAHLSCSALFPFRPEGCLCHKLAMPHFLQASSRARPGSPNTASGPTEAPGVSRVGACHRLPTQEQARDALDVPRNGTPHPRAVPTRLRTRPSTQDAKALPGPSLTRGAGAPRPPPSTGIWRAVTWHPPHRVSGPQGRSGRVGPPDQRD